MSGFGERYQQAIDRQVPYMTVAEEKIEALEAQLQKRPHQCPVCFGVGAVSPGFYVRTGTTTWQVSSTVPELCRSCSGTGIVWG